MTNKAMKHERIFATPKAAYSSKFPTKVMLLYQELHRQMNLLLSRLDEQQWR